MLSALVAANATPIAARVTVDDLMKLRTIVDVKISPDGSSVAYAVSTPSLDRNAHEVALFVVPATGGTPTPLARGSVLTSSPNLRWSPGGRTISFLATATGRTQVYEVNPSAAAEAPKPMTNAAAVITYEWAPDGKSIAYVTRDADVRGRGTPAAGQVVRDARRRAGAPGATRGAGRSTARAPARR